MSVKRARSQSSLINLDKIDNLLKINGGAARPTPNSVEVDRVQFSLKFRIALSTLSPPRIVRLRRRAQRSSSPSYSSCAMPEAARTLQKQPSLTVSPPEGEQPKQKGWISRTLRRSDSALRGREDSLTSENRPDPASIREGRLAPSSASRTSLATSDYSGDFEPVDPPPMPALNPPRALAASNASAATSGAGSAIVPAPLAQPPKIPARNPTRSLKESTASSAFLSVSPAHGPSNASATLPLTSLYLVSGLPKSPQTWTLADHDSTAGVHHSEGAP